MAADGLFLFGVAGMALAAMGIYGLVSYTVKQSTHEIGIRMALGAQRLAVVWHFLRRGLRPGGIGVILGIVAALVLTRLSAACSTASARPIPCRSPAPSRSFSAPCSWPR